MTSFSRWLEKNGKTIDTCTPNDVETYKNDVAKRSSNSANVFLTVIKQYYTWKMGSADVTDAGFQSLFMKVAQIKSIKKARKKDDVFIKKALTIKEIKHLLKKMYVEGAEQIVIDGVVLHLYFGARAKELALYLDYSKIDWDKHEMYLISAKRAGKHTRYLPWHHAITPYLIRWYEHIPFKYPGWWLTSRLVAGKYTAGGLNIKSHTFRRTFETNMRLLGVNQFLIDMIMGHQTHDMPSLYTDRTMFNEAVRKVMEEQHYMVVNGVLDYLEGEY